MIPRIAFAGGGRQGTDRAATRRPTPRAAWAGSDAARKGGMRGGSAGVPPAQECSARGPARAWRGGDPGPGGAYQPLNLCEGKSCVHISFVWSLPDVYEILRTKGKRNPR